MQATVSPAQESAERQLAVLRQALEQFAVEKEALATERQALDAEQRQWERVRGEFDAGAVQDFLQRLRQELQEVVAVKAQYESACTGVGRKGDGADAAWVERKRWMHAALQAEVARVQGLARPQGRAPDTDPQGAGLGRFRASLMQDTYRARHVLPPNAGVRSSLCSRGAHSGRTVRWASPDWGQYADVAVTLEVVFDTRRIFAEMDEEKSGLLTLAKLGDWLLKNGLSDVTYADLQKMLRQVLLGALPDDGTVCCRSVACAFFPSDHLLSPPANPMRLFCQATACLATGQPTVRHANQLSTVASTAWSLAAPTAKLGFGTGRRRKRIQNPKCWRKKAAEFHGTKFRHWPPKPRPVGRMGRVTRKPGIRYWIDGPTDGPMGHADVGLIAQIVCCSVGPVRGREPAPHLFFFFSSRVFISKRPARRRHCYDSEA